MKRTYDYCNNGHISSQKYDWWLMNVGYLTHVNSLFSQFSDNGLVQFQSVAENEQYLFPAPLSSGFPNMNVSLLAPFWDDSDLTLGEGRLLYQVRHQHMSESASKAAMSHQIIHHFQLFPLLVHFFHLVGIPWDGYVKYLLSDSVQSYSRQSDQIRGAERQSCLHAYLDPQNHLGPCYAHLLPEDQPLRGYNMHVFQLYKPWF